MTNGVNYPGTALLILIACQRGREVALRKGHAGRKREVVGEYVLLYRVRHHARDEGHDGDLPVIKGVEQLEVFSVTLQDFLQHPGVPELASLLTG